MGKKDIEYILKVIYESLENLSNATKERSIQDILAAVLNCECRKTIDVEGIPKLEVDLIWNDYWVEVKYNEKYYAGVGQIIVQQVLHSHHKNVLLHVNPYIESATKNAFRKLAKKVGFIGVLVDSRKKEIFVVK